MTGLRLFAHAWHRLSLAVALCTLAVRLIVPAGFMPDVGRFALVLCSGHGPMAATMTMSHGRTAPSDDGDKSEQPCGFGGTLVSALPAIDPVVLLAAIAFILAVGHVAGDVLPVRVRDWLRPPLRGPPAFRPA